MTFDVRNLSFDYHTDNSDAFIKDFMNYVATNMPFYAWEDELLYLMDTQNITHFLMPSSKTKDGLAHTFYFEIKKVPENAQLKIYSYLGMDLKRKGLTRDIH